MGNIVDNSNGSISFDSIKFQDFIELPNDCKYTTSISNCSATCGEGTQQIRHIITKQPFNDGKTCPVDFTRKCNQICETSSFISILNIPKQESEGSKLFAINLNNVSPVTFKEGFYISIDYNSFVPVNFQFISIYIDNTILPISYSSEIEKDGNFKHLFFIPSSITLKEYSKIVLNLFIWNTYIQDSSYTIKIDANVNI